MSKPRVLYYDIETGFNLVYKYHLYPEYVNYKNVQTERYIICAAWKWDGEKKIHTSSILDNPKAFKADPHDDRIVVKELAKVMNEADYVVAHNGDRFDMRFLKGRMLVHGVPPFSMPQQEDTLKIAKTNFNLNSNRLDYIANLLGLGKKVETPPNLWHDCFKGSEKAVQSMVKYNKGDVQLLEEVYKTMRPYSRTKVNHGLFSVHDCCPKCGSEDFTVHHNKVFTTSVGTYASAECHDCGGWFSDRTKIRGTRFKQK